MQTAESFAERLLATRFIADEVPPTDDVGVYAFHLGHGCLPGLELCAGAVLYVGMTESSFSVRNHFKHKDSGYSSPRRSLGAILKTELHLSAIPRSSKSKNTSYRFQDAGEIRLTDWMRDHLTYSFVVVGKDDVRKIEKALIGLLKPPLNLTHWPNPQRPALKLSRKACSLEAKAMGVI